MILEASQTVKGLMEQIKALKQSDERQKSEIISFSQVAED